MNEDDLARRLFGVFLIELEEQLAVLNKELLALETEPKSTPLLGSVFRVVHTLKGAAHAAHVPEVEEVCHVLESLLAAAREGKLVLAAKEFSVLFESADALSDARERLVAGRPLDDSPLAALRLRLRGGLSGGEASELPDAVEIEREPPPPLPVPSGTPVTNMSEQVRVEAEKLDSLVAAVSQLVISGGRVAALPGALDEIREAAGRWSTEWDRSARALRFAVQGSPEETAVRHALERVARNVRQIVADSRRLSAEAREDVRGLLQVTSEIGVRVQGLRLRPFSDACRALPRAVRDLASATGKEIRFELVGGSVEVDRTVVDLLGDPLLQLVRNAIDHGIEGAEERASSGKPRDATVTVSAAVEGGRLFVRVRDDGRGLDRAAITAESARRGLPIPETDGDLAQLLFRAGFSSRSEATSISGRGVGLDVVAAAMARAGGSVSMASFPGQGTTFTLECPPSLATLHALLVTLGSQVLAIPSAHVERVLEVGAEDIRRAEGRSVLNTPDGLVPLVSLANLLGPPYRMAPVADRFLLVRILAGGRRLAVVVDGLSAVEDIVVRPISGVGSPAPLVSGAALLATGRVALVLNTTAAVEEGLRHAREDFARGDTTPAVPARRRILVADDSITTRTLEQSILEAAGYEVLTAVDGSDAWRLLQERACDLLVSDVEMPRMDGFSLCAAIRGSPRLARLPVVLVTGLDQPDHRERGLEAGADAYLPKSSFDHQELLETIQQLLG
ncbi:MAG: response regulator [Gemmatimonadetes bacterium]|nr:response regulator [Gemmatimonadota bacterium]